jgi:hypothetical protein
LSCGPPIPGASRGSAQFTGGHVIPANLPEGFPPRPVTQLLSFSAVLDDVNANGGPGAGFIPVGA